MKQKIANINIEEFDGKAFQIQVFEPESSALVTHYLHNFRNGIKTFYEKSALESLNNFIEYKQKSENKNIIAEDAMQMLLFEVENVPFPTPEKYDFKFIDLFAGIGGFRLALQNKTEDVFSRANLNLMQKKHIVKILDKHLLEILQPIM